MYTDTMSKKDVDKCSAEANPFMGMKIKDWKSLDKVEGRSICLKCNKSRKYFCYTCYIPVSTVQDCVPKVKLPLKIDIIKHSHEIDGKSTAAHAAVIAPDDVTIYTYPCIPDYSAEENVVLIFPGKNALTIQEYIEQEKKTRTFEDEECLEPKHKRAHIASRVPISKAVFIDSTWNQSRGIYKDQRFRDMPCVVFQSRISQFWRHQHGSPRWFLATIEAIHQFLVELHVHCNLGNNQADKIECNAEGASNLLSSTSMENEKKVEATFVNRKQACGEEEINKEDLLSVERNCSNNLSSDCSVNSQTDKPPSKFVKNLALCRGVRVDPGGDASIKLFGPDQWKGNYDGEYDNLLFFFQFMYFKIHSIYDHSKLHSYQRPLQ